ncbi:ParB/Srx family N-terminal domain-containing protein [Paraburkholderia nemoris]|uniref:ParB-like protein n=1 Tax=Paraburkholderia nemoris TaxID=2793076 RepID=UPI0038B94562
MKTAIIKDLRPTQLTHGLREIRQKIQFYQSLSGHDLDMAIAEKPVPLVIGPGGSSFAIDHHHVATALWHAGIKVMPAVLVADFSSLPDQEFWLSMENRRWTYPYDAKGQRRCFTDMPAHVWELADDEYRSLAASVRDAGGYEKTTVPLEEFRWADLFRTYLPYPGTDDEFASVERQALKLAKSKAAAGLPGYLGKARR